MDPQNLSEEQLNYELALRSVSPEGLATRRIKGIKLKTLLQREFRDGKPYDSSAHAM